MYMTNCCTAAPLLPALLLSVGSLLAHRRDYMRTSSGGNKEPQVRGAAICSRACVGGLEAACPFCSSSSSSSGGGSSYCTIRQSAAKQESCSPGHRCCC
jgi:hypothetical protein